MNKYKNIIVKPNKKDIKRVLQERDEATFQKVTKQYVDEMNKLICELEALSVNSTFINDLKDYNLAEVVEGIDYLNMSFNEIEEWFGYLESNYYEIMRIYGRAKKGFHLKEKYCEEIAMLVEQLYEHLDELVFADEAYLRNAAWIKANIPEDYSSRIIYENVKEADLNKTIQFLRRTLESVQLELQNMQIRKTNLEIGAKSLEVLGITSIDEIDEAIRKKHEEQEKQRDEEMHTFASALSAVNGDKTSLDIIWGKNETSEDTDV